MLYPPSRQQSWVPEKLRKRKKDESQRQGKTDRGKEKGMVDGHQNLFRVTRGETFKCPILSDHKSNNVRQKQTV